MTCGRFEQTIFAAMGTGGFPRGAVAIVSGDLKIQVAAIRASAGERVAELASLLSSRSSFAAGRVPGRRDRRTAVSDAPARDVRSS